MGGFYRILWGALALIGQRWIAWAGGLAFVVLYAAAYGRPLDALPLLVLWALFVASCRMLLRMLPVPRGLDPHRAAVLPPPQIAVSVAPHASPPADLAGMRSALPKALYQLLSGADEGRE